MSTSNFEPDRFDVTDVTRALQAVVTTDGDHSYGEGWWVRLIVPVDYGMHIPYIAAQVVEIPASDELKLDLDTRNELPFTVPVTTPNQVAQVVPISGTTLNTAV